MKRAAYFGLIVVGAGLAIGLMSVQARAHAFPERSEPRVGLIVDAPPAEVRIWFDGRLEPLFSVIEIFNQAGARVDAGKGGVDPDHADQLATPLPPLPAGRYTIHWDVLAVDGHRTEGRFIFSIRAAP